jgi:hypothetical protein
MTTNPSDIVVSNMPADKLAGREAENFAERDRKLDAARERRRLARQVA